MKVIWKYPLEPRDVQTIQMPKRAQILTVQNQREQICLWAVVDPGEPLRLGKIRILGTGHTHSPEFFDHLRYIGSIQQDEGRLVWHVFEEMEE